MEVRESSGADHEGKRLYRAEKVGVEERPGRI
jgi:hypothetical protein